ncbi:MAG: hypothetical protein IJO78_01220 [Erysipelotrichaceae bacterium]|nr:hypothetical protein [Erysipelotrichaceae bacterium]
MSFVREMNLEYAPIWDVAQQMFITLADYGYECDMEFSIFNTVKENGEWLEERFPIPVITVNDVFKILVHPTHIALTLPMHREMASRFRFQSFLPMLFDIHGMEDMNVTFYESGDAFDDVAQKILESNETYVGVTFSLPLLPQSIANVLELLAFAAHV